MFLDFFICVFFLCYSFFLLIGFWIVEYSLLKNVCGRFLVKRSLIRNGVLYDYRLEKLFGVFFFWLFWIWRWDIGGKWFWKVFELVWILLENFLVILLMLYLLILFNGILKLGMIKDGKGWFEVILKLLELINKYNNIIDVYVLWCY